MSKLSVNNQLEIQGPKLALILVGLALFSLLLGVGMGVWWYLQQQETAKVQAEAKKLLAGGGISAPSSSPEKELEMAVEQLPVPNEEQLRAEMEQAAQRCSVRITNFELAEAPGNMPLAAMSQTHPRLARVSFSGEYPAVIRFLHAAVESRPLRWLTLFQVDTSSGEPVYSMEVIAATL